MIFKADVFISKMVKVIIPSLCKLVFRPKELKSLSPRNFCFTVIRNTHNISTRNANKMKICYHETNFYCQSINHCGINFIIPNDLVDSDSFYLIINMLLNWIKDTELNLDKLIYPHGYV